jgi:hypothetical protein
MDFAEFHLSYNRPDVDLTALDLPYEVETERGPQGGSGFFAVGMECQGTRPTVDVSA